MSEEKPKGEGGMKSVLEIALEKTARFKGEESAARLTPEQKARVNEIEKEYAARLAEKEIMFQSQLKELIQRYGPSEELRAQSELMREAFAREQGALRAEKEARIQEIRQGKQQTTL